MSDNNWTDMIAGERMQVDQEFEDRLTASSFSRQQWGLVMTAVEFEIENPDDPASARLYADTSKLSSVMSRIEQLGEQGGSMGGLSPEPSTGGSGGGLLSKLTSALSLGGGGGGGKLQAEAEELAEEYAEELQNRLKNRGRWKTICAQAAGGSEAE
ncbi:MAG: DUF5799 family protein [Halapricum sp.]